MSADTEVTLPPNQVPLTRRRLPAIKVSRRFVTEQGRVTIPEQYRDLLGEIVEVRQAGAVIELRPVVNRCCKACDGTGVDPNG